MKRLAALLLAILLAGCTTYQGYGYSDEGYYDDRYYEGPDYYRGSAERDRYYNDGQAYYGYGAFDYGVYPYYYSSLWPIYHGYYDPFYNPYFHYGITYFPRSYFSLNYGGIGYPHYQPYAPYRYSWYDNYFGVGWQRERRRNRHDDFGPQRSAFGSARNQAERMAAWTGADRIGSGSQQRRGQRSIQPGFRNRSERGPAVPQRSAPMSPARSQLPAPRPRSRQYDRGGGGNPPPQANRFGPQSEREDSPRWQSDRRWSAGQGDGSAVRGGRGSSTPTGMIPAARTIGGPAALSDHGGTAIPSRRSYRAATTPAPDDGREVRGAAGLEPRTATGLRREDQGRRYFNPSPPVSPTAEYRGSIQLRPQTDRGLPAGRAYRPLAPAGRAPSDFRGAAPAPQQQAPYQPSRSAPPARAERPGGEDGGADDSERRRQR